MHGRFVWADLSTFRPEVTEPFYTKVMGWAFQDGVAHVGQAPVAMLYTMPEKFQAIGMPSFWMSYIAVDSVEAAVATAQAHGSKVELGPVAYEEGQIALIRDPLGAGFTVYEGPSIEGATRGFGARAGHSLFLSDVSAVEPFYEALFGWKFRPSEDGQQAVSLGGRHLFYAHTIPDPAMRGEEEYWAVLLHAPRGFTKKAVEAAGGTIGAQFELPEGQTSLVYDPDGAAFFVLEEVSGAV